MKSTVHLKLLILVATMGVCSHLTPLPGQNGENQSPQTILIPQGDTVTFKLDFRFGWNRWQYSYNGINWANTSSIGNTYKFPCIRPIWIRTFVSNGSCNPQYSGPVSLIPFGPPNLKNTFPENLTTSSVEFGGQITYDGADSIYDKGIFYYLLNSETPGILFESAGKGPGDFKKTIDGLLANTFYSMTSYAGNKYGIGYATADTFCTFLEPSTFPIGVNQDDAVNRVVLTPPKVLYANYSTVRFEINLDNDTLPDLIIIAEERSSPGGFHYRHSKVYSWQSVKLATTGFNPTKFQQGDLIQSNQNWNSSQLDLAASYNGVTPWADKTGYVCFRRKEGGRYRYGWVKLSVMNITTVTIYEYAYMK